MEEELKTKSEQGKDKKKQKKEKQKKPRKIKPRDINLVTALADAYAADEREKKKGRPGAIIYILGVLAVLGMAGFYATRYMERAALEAENEDLLFDLYSPIKLEQYEEAEQAGMRSSYLKKLEKKTAAILAPLSETDSQYPYYTNTLFSTIKGQFKNRIELMAIDLTDETLTLELNAKEASDAAAFVKRLRELEIFEEIRYEGFSGDEDTGEAIFEVVCTFPLPETEPAPLPVSETVEGGED